MASPLQTLIATTVLVSLFLGCADKASAVRYTPNSSNTIEIKRSEFAVNIAPQRAGLIPRLGRLLLPPQPKTPFHPYKNPLVSAAPVPSHGTPSHCSQFAPSPGNEASSPSSGEDQVPPVPQPKQ